MLLNTAPYKLKAHFFMKGEPVEYDDTLPVIAPSQVHGSEIIHVNDENFAEIGRPEADGVLLTTTKASASLRFADCTPVMLWGKDWVMILHSGYKGTVLNIAGKGLALVNASEASAWIGPCIGYEHYCRDVSDEWTQKGMQSFHAANFEERDGKIYFDLAGEIHSQLLDCGVSEERITLTGIDTFTDLRCYSYRRGDKAERMTLYVKIVQESMKGRI